MVCAMKTVGQPQWGSCILKMWKHVTRTGQCPFRRVVLLHVHCSHAGWPFINNRDAALDFPTAVNKFKRWNGEIPPDTSTAYLREVISRTLPGRKGSSWHNTYRYTHTHIDIHIKCICFNTFLEYKID